MDRDYYQQYRQIELNHWWFQARERILKHLLRCWAPDQVQGRPLRILNVGCATGRTSEWLGEFGEVESIEYDTECAEMARQFTGLPIRPGSAEALPYGDGSFDVVTAFDVLEHIPGKGDQVAALEMMRVCAPGGLVLVTVPAFQELWSEHDDVNQHCRRYRSEGITALFDGKNPKGLVLKSGYFNFWLFPGVALIRLAQRALKAAGLVKRDKPASDFDRDQNNLLSPMLRSLMTSERHVLASDGLSFPFGISALVAWRAFR